MANKTSLTKLLIFWMNLLILTQTNNKAEGWKFEHKPRRPTASDHAVYIVFGYDEQRV